VCVLTYLSNLLAALQQLQGCTLAVAGGEAAADALPQQSALSQHDSCHAVVRPIAVVWRMVLFQCCFTVVLHVLPVCAACMLMVGSSMVMMSAHSISEGVQGYS
jgi:NAD-dependent SIR2 family protein deacetylase